MALVFFRALQCQEGFVSWCLCHPIVHQGTMLGSESQGSWFGSFKSEHRNIRPPVSLGLQFMPSSQQDTKHMLNKHLG